MAEGRYIANKAERPDIVHLIVQRMEPDFYFSGACLWSLSRFKSSVPATAHTGALGGNDLGIHSPRHFSQKGLLQKAAPRWKKSESPPSAIFLIPLFSS